MYIYRRSTPTQRAELLTERRERQFPRHSTPHLAAPESIYLVTAACYEHQPLMLSAGRRRQILNELKIAADQNNANIHAWVVLPNHYHLIVETPSLRKFGFSIGQAHGRTSHQWNREDSCRGRKCWYRFSDRIVRSESHYFAVLNYIHANPVKHGFVESALDWTESSLHEYQSELGIEKLREWWLKYPVGKMGDGWDDEHLSAPPKR